MIDGTLFPRVISGSARWGVTCGASEHTLQLLPDNSVDSLLTDPPGGIGFMGKEWDSDRGGRVPWTGWLTGVLNECYRVLKPGGYGFVWAIPRTSHWTAVALEDAHFHVVDYVTHLFGTGFPKSVDVGKAIDRKLGNARKVLGPKIHGDGKPTHAVSAAAMLASAGKCQSGRTTHPSATAPASPEAARWDGWGTALKPAVEFWILVIKPRGNTIADNVLTHGVGALNIDGCRIATADKLTRKLGKSTTSVSGWKSTNRAEIAGKDGGRWPANLVVSHSPDCPDAACVADCPVPGIEQQGGSRRFLYTIKPSRRERDLGLDDFVPRSGGEATGRKDGSAGLQNPRAGAGRNGGARNHHPCVKSIALTRWLARLITPPNGLVLDPFVGSGSTGCASVLEGFRFIGIDQDPHYVDLARARIRYWQGQRKAGNG